MTAYRPDLLPFALPTTLGCPYHGRVVADSLTLPNAEVIEYPSPSDGRTHLVQHSRAALLTRTPDEAADDAEKGYQWLNYAILSGSGTQICGQQLGGTQLLPCAIWLYCDANAAWVISAKWERYGTIQQKLTIRLEKPFGRLPAISMTPRDLVSYIWTPLRESGADQTTGLAALDRHIDVTHSKTGVVSCFNIGAYGSLGLEWGARLTDYPPAGGTQHTVGYHDAIKITLSGDGALAGAIGDGISATVTHLAQAPSMHSDTGFVTTGTLCSGALAETQSRTETYEFFYVAMQDGSVSNISRSVVQDVSVYYHNLSCPSMTWDYSIQTTTETAEFSWAGHTRDGLTTYTLDSRVGEIVHDGPGVPVLFRVHPNVLGMLYDDAAFVLALGGTELDITGYSDAPHYESVTWHPVTNQIVFVDDGDAGCFV